jgi:nucleotidyltransferase/DNA polymerase involved in DNA repair
MEACVGTSALLAKTEVPACAMHATAAVARRDSMLAELCGVPKPMLQTVFGKTLGQRIWEQGRRVTRHGIESQAAPASGSDARATASGLGDAEIVAGMIEYVSQRAGETLRESGRQAKAIGLRIAYADGVSRLDRMRLARPTNEGPELVAAAMELFWRSDGRDVPVESVDLRVTSVQAEAVRERANGLHYAMASAAGARA